MPTITFKEASAASAVGTNLMPARFATSPKFRRISRIGVVGSAVLGDASLDVYYGDHYVGTFFPTTIGVVIPVDSKDMIPVSDDTLCQPGEPISVIVSDASATNVFVVTLEIQEF